MSASLQLRGVTKVFPSTGRRGAPTTAIEDIDLDVGAGELVCLVGASGCGKSTLLSVVAGLAEPTEGEVTVDGRQVIGPGPDRAVVFQSYSLFPWRTVAENVAFGLEVAHVSKPDIKRRVAALLDVVQLAKWADARPSQLSGGMRQRVAIARSLATEPEVLLLDEPFGALDAQTRTLMQDYLRSIWARLGTTILMVTHDVEEALYLAQRVYVLASHPGRVKCEIEVPFGPERAQSIRRDARFLDLRDEIHGLLLEEHAEV
jgi:NitT/TauT family transport system ATP-binding protein